MNRPLYQQQDPELRRLKEAFVSNLQGTTRWEVFCVLSSLPLCLLTAAYIEARLAARLRSSSLSKQHWQLPKFPFEFCGVVLPLLMLLMSAAPAEPAFLLLFLFWGSLALKLWMRLAHGPAARQHMAHMLQHMTCSRKRFVSAFRGGVMAATCVAILGVDFPTFPRRYAKAEGYGGGVMDVGVGAIVFAGGLVSAVAAGAAAADTAAACAATGTSSSTAAAARKGISWSSSIRLRLVQLGRGVKAAVPLLLLGGAREIATAFVGYQAHLGEYGLHWNFFYTIAAVTVLTLAVPVPARWLGPLGVALTTAHQVLLSADVSKWTGSSTGFPEFMGHSIPAGLYEAVAAPSSSSGTGGVGDIASSPPAAAIAAAAGSVKTLGAWVHLDLGIEARQAAGYWASNKEGLASLPGYWALYAFGAAIGHHLGVSCAFTAAQARAQLSSGSSSGRPGGSAAAVGEAGRLVWAWVGVWWVVDLALWALLAAVEAAAEPVSRRSCNLPYVLWTTAQCLAWLLLVVMADLLTSVICSSSGGCGTSTGGSALLAPPAAGGYSLTRGPVRRSLDASAAAGHPQQGSSSSPSAGGSSSCHVNDFAAGGAGQYSPLPPSPKTGLQRRSAQGRRGSGSGPMAAAAAAAALTAAAAVGGGGIAAGGSTAAVAAAAAAAVDSPPHSGSSRENSPRNPSASRSAAAVGSPRGGGGSDKGSSRGGVSDPSSNSSSGAQPAGGGSASSTPVRGRRQGSRLQAPQQQQQQYREEASHVSSSRSSTSSGGPMRLMLAFNRNMLALFLVANLLTGAVNLSVNTLAVGSWAARIIVGVYMLVLCTLAVLLDKRGITLKPW